MDKKSQKDGGKRWLLWLLLVLILAGVFIWLIVRNNGKSLNIQDLSISSSSKNSISLEIEAEGDGLKYYYSLDGQHFTEENGPNFTISGLSENTTYTLYIKVVDKYGNEKVEQKTIKTAGDSSKVSLTLERTELTVAPEGEKVSIAISGKGYGKLSCKTSDQLVAKCEVKDLSLIVVPGTKAGKTTITVTEDSYNVSAKLKVTSEKPSVPSTEGGEQGGYTPTPQPTPEPEPVYYTVSFTTNGFGAVSKSSVSVLAGTSVSTPNAAAKVGDNEITATPNAKTAQYSYAFSNWTNTCGTTVNTNCTLTANFTRSTNQYTVTFKNEGTIAYAANFNYGTMPQYVGETPVKDATAEYTYTFKGWNPELALVTGNATYNAEYNSIKNKYTVSFIDGLTEEEISHIVLDYGTEIEMIPNEPYHIGYHFTGWDNEPAGHIVTGNVTFTAEYEINTYEVTFKDFDGTELKKETVVHGQAATAPADPTREGYDFKGWNKEFSNITSDLIVKATYEIKHFTVVFQDEDGTQIGEAQTVDWNEAATAPADPTKEGYDFKNWDKEFSHITEDTIITAVYEIKHFTVVFQDDDGTQIGESQTVDWNEAATAPADPTKEGYTFDGWDTEFEHVKTDLTIKATYKINDYAATITVKTTTPYGTVSKSEVVKEFGTLVSTSNNTITFGDTIVSANANDNTAEYTYAFVKWTHNCGNLLIANCTVEAEFSRTKNSYAVSFNNGEHGTKPQDQTVEYGSKVTEPNISEDGWRLIGWYTDGSFTTKWNFDNDTVKDTLNLYAKWTEEVTSDFQTVEYIQAVGNAYLNTGYIPNENTKIEVKYAFISTTVTGEKVQFVFGSTADSSQDYMGIQYGFSQTIDFPNSPSHRMGTKKVVDSPIDTNTHTAIFDAPNKTVKFDNGTARTDAYNWNSAYSSGLRPIYLFASNQGQVYYSHGNVKIYSFKIYESNVLKKEYVPTYQWSTSKYGFIETQSGSFFTGSNGGFTGPEAGCHPTQGCLVSFDMNGIGTQISSFRVAAGSKIQKPTDPIDSTGVYTFKGWYKDSSHNFAWDFNNDTVDDATTLYAKWSKDNCLIKFDLGEVDATPIDQVLIATGTALSEPATPIDPVGSYLFAGWYKDSSFEYKWNFDNVVDEDMTLYAKWSKEYNVVTYWTNGVIDEMEPSLVRFGAKLSKPTDPVDPTGDFDFYGWFKDSAFETEWNFEEDTVDGDTTIYAKWFRQNRIQEVEYVQPQAAGTYFETGVIVDPDTKVEVTYQFTNWGGEQFVLGALNTNPYNGFQLGMGSAAVSARKLSIRLGTADSMVHAPDKNKHTVIMDAPNKQVTYDDALESTEYTWGSSNVSGSLKVFATIQGGTVYATNSNNIRVYSLKIYKNDTLIKDYRPAVRDGIYGFYEATEGKFKESNAGNLIGGDATETEPYVFPTVLPTENLILTAPRNAGVRLLQGWGGADIEEDYHSDEGNISKHYFFINGTGKYQTVCGGGSFYSVTQDQYIDLSQAKTGPIILDVDPGEKASGGWQTASLWTYTPQFLNYLDNSIAGMKITHATAFTVPSFNDDKAANQFTTQEEMWSYLQETDTADDDMYIYELGKSYRGKSIPVVIFTKSDISSCASNTDPVACAAEIVKQNGKITVMFHGQIHGYEPSGSEGAMAAVRAIDLGENGTEGILEDINIISVPRYNVDGSESNSMGNAQGINMNRDNINVDSPESTAVHKLYNLFTPEVTLDMHEQYVHAGGDSITFVDANVSSAYNNNNSDEYNQFERKVYQEFMGEINKTDIVASSYVFDGYFADLVNASLCHPYYGLRGSVSFLVEVNGLNNGKSFWPRRVLTHYTAAIELVKYAAANKDEIKSKVANARLAIANEGATYEETDLITLAHSTSNDHAITIRRPTYNLTTGEPININATATIGFHDRSTRTRTRPTAYVISKSVTNVSKILTQFDKHNIQYYEIESGSKAVLSNYSGTTSSASLNDPTTVTFPDGAYVIPMNQDTGNIIALIMEPDNGDISTFGGAAKKGWITLGETYRSQLDLIDGKMQLSE